MSAVHHIEILLIMFEVKQILQVSLYRKGVPEAEKRISVAAVAGVGDAAFLIDKGHGTRRMSADPYDIDRPITEVEKVAVVKRIG